MRRLGFTLIELLVVIGILALLMGLTLGGIAAMKKTDRLLVTEHLVGDVIRQARHTARTSGSPVVVSINNVQGKGWVSGISRVPIWTEGFDGGPGGFAGNITGVAGKGCLIPLSATVTYPSKVLERGVKIVRGGQADGFYLTCQVRPPLARVGSGQLVIPLLTVGSDQTQANSLGGLMLRHVERDQQLVSAFAPGTESAPPPPSSMPGTPRLATWEIVGWINDTSASGTLIEVSSVAIIDRPLDLLRDELPLHVTVTNEDVAWPMAGGRWEEIGLLVDRPGRRMVLYRNGVRVGEKRLATPPTFAAADETITVGGLDLGAGPFPASNTIFDEVAVYRLAAADPARLPGDVVPAAEYRIVAQPDGRVEVDYADASATFVASATTTFVAPERSLTFSGTFNQASQASLAISIDGRVSGRINP